MDKPIKEKRKYINGDEFILGYYNFYYNLKLYGKPMKIYMCVEKNCYEGYSNVSLIKRWGVIL